MENGRNGIFRTLTAVLTTALISSAGTYLAVGQSKADIVEVERLEEKVGTLNYALNETLIQIAKIQVTQQHLINQLQDLQKGKRQ